MFKTPFSKVCDHSGAQNEDFIIFGGWSNDRCEGGLNSFYVSKSNFGLDFERSQHQLKIRFISMVNTNFGL